MDHVRSCRSKFQKCPKCDEKTTQDGTVQAFGIMMSAIRLVGYGSRDSRMEWVLRLVETGIDGQTQGCT